MNTDNTNPTMKNSRKIDFTLSSKMKNDILNGKTTLASLFGAGSAIAFISAKNAMEDDPGIESDMASVEENDFTASLTMQEEVIEVPDSMSFSEAFAAQRELQGAGGLFKYKGNYFNTYYKEEWEDLSESDKADYFARIEDSIDYESSQIVDNSNGEIININIDSDPQPEIILNDADGDGIIEIDRIDLNNDGLYDVIHDQSPKAETISADEEILDMKSEFEDLNTSEFPEEVVFTPEDEITDEDLASFIVDEATNSNVEDDFIQEEDLTEEEEEIDTEFIAEEDLDEPSVMIEEDDLADPSMEDLNVDTNIEEISDVDPMTNDSEDIDLSEFDF